jgi:hypothetical protein
MLSYQILIEMNSVPSPPFGTSGWLLGVKRTAIEILHESASNKEFKYCRRITNVSHGHLQGVALGPRDIFSPKIVCKTVGASSITDTQFASPEYSYSSLVPIMGFPSSSTVSYMRYCPGACLETLRKPIKYQST